MSDLGEWSEIEKGPARNQSGNSLGLRITGALCVAAGCIAAGVQASDSTATPGLWAYWVGGGIVASLPFFFLARVFDYLMFTAARLHRLTKAEAAERKDAA